MNEVLKLIETGTFAGTVTDWYKFLGFCDFHRMTGYLADTLTATQEVPGQVKRHARIQKAYQIYKQSSLKNAAKILSAQLEEKAIPHAFLKGIVLMDELYDTGGRCSNDIDLLVLPEDVGRVSEIIKNSGYVQGVYKNGQIMQFGRMEIIKRRMNRGETAPFVKLTNDSIAPFIEIDINFSLDWLPTNENKLVESFLEHTYISKNGLRSLDSVHMLVYLCMHLYKEAVVYSMVERMKDIELYKYLDIFKMIQLIGIKGLMWLADIYGLRKQCEYAVWCTKQLFPSLDVEVEKPGEVDKVFDPENGNREYLWSNSFLERLDDTARLNHLMPIDLKR